MLLTDPRVDDWNPGRAYQIHRVSKLRFEKARDKQTQMAASVNTDQPQGAQAPAVDQPAAVAPAGGAPAGDEAPAVSTEPTPAPASNNSRARGMGKRGRGGRGGSGFSDTRTSPNQVSGEAPVRCSNPHPSGRGYCSTPNFPEAKECKVCGGRVSHQGAGPSCNNMRGRGSGF